MYNVISIQQIKTLTLKYEIPPIHNLSIMRNKVINISDKCFAFILSNIILYCG